jgi:hypothetical protein
MIQKKEKTKMTKAQEKAVARIKYLAFEGMYGETADRYEFKKWEVNEHEFFVEVITETGMKNDEGTMAEIYCRDHAQLFIGKRGGITYPVRSSKTKKIVCRRFGGYSILQAVIDQRI